MNDASQKAGACRRFGLRFSLRALLLLMLAVCICFALLGWNLRRARLQTPAVATLQELGARVRYEFHGTEAAELFGWQYKAANHSPYPDWLIDRLGIDFFHDVTGVRHQDSRKLADKDIERFWQAIEALPKVRRLETSFGTTQPGTLRHLQRHRELEVAVLRWANLSDADFAVLATLPLVELNLNETTVTEEGLRYLGEIQSLERLELHHSRVTDAGVMHLRNLPKLEYLNLSGTSVGDEGLKALAGLPSLKILELRRTGISDRGLFQLKGFWRLEELDLGRNEITFQGVEHLHKLPCLRRLTVPRDALDEGANCIASFTRLEELQIVPTPDPWLVTNEYQAFQTEFQSRYPNIRLTTSR